MMRFYFVSTVIHLILFLWLYSIDFFGTASKDESVQNEYEISEKIKEENE